MSLDVADNKAELCDVVPQENTSNYSISPACGLVVIELSANDLLVGAKGKVEAIKVIGYAESLASRLQRARKAAN